MASETNLRSKVGMVFLLIMLAAIGCCSSKTSGVEKTARYHWRLHDLKSSRTFNVVAFGAKGDGKSDDRDAFLRAFAAACQGPALESAKVLVPRGKTFLVSTFTLKNCTAKAITWQVNGNIIAPADPKTWPSPLPYYGWLNINDTQHFTLRGSGSFDGAGQIWWLDPKQQRPRLLVFSGCNDLIIRGVTFKNGAYHQLVIRRSARAQIYRVSVTSPVDSPNTDGFQTRELVNATIANCRISTGDDNISIQNGTRNLLIKNCFFGTGHGVSIGSLGGKNSTGCVSGITVKRCTFSGTENGVRIKTWQGGHGTVTNVVYRNLRMSRVAFPIIINQFYCDRLISGPKCEQVTSENATVISGVVFRDIAGTFANSSTYDSNIGTDYSYSKPALLKCSGAVPCQISMRSVYLTNAADTLPSTPLCQNVYGQLSDALPGCNVKALPIPALAATQVALEVENCRKHSH